MHELLSLVVEVPPPDADYKRCYKHPFVACELLACEFPAFLNKLVENPGAMDFLFSVLSGESLNLTLAGYFSKAFGALMSRCSLKLLEYLFSQHRAINSLIRHIRSRSIADALLRVLTVDDDIYISQRGLIIEALVNLLQENDLFLLNNVTELLCDLNQRCDELKVWAMAIIPLTTERILGKLVQVMTSDNDFCVKAALSVVNSLLNNAKFRQLLDPTVLQNWLQATIPALESVLTKPCIWSMSTAFGQSILCLGETKIRGLELITTLYRTGTDGSLLALSCLPELAISLFLKFPWNSLLHQACLQLVQAIMSGDLKQQLQFLAQTRLPAKIATLGLTDTLESGQSMRKCALGYAIRMAQMLQKAASAPEIALELESCIEWNQYVAEVLEPLLKVESTNIGAERKSSDETLFDTGRESLAIDGNTAQNALSSFSNGTHEGQVKPNEEIEKEVEEAVTKPIDINIGLQGQPRFASTDILLPAQLEESSPFNAYAYWRLPAATIPLPDLD